MLHRFGFPRSFLFSLSFLAVGVMLWGYTSSPMVRSATFLPDDAEVACRAILPQCFKRSDWADLCARDSSVAAAHPEACRASGFEQGQPPQGR